MMSSLKTKTLENVKNLVRHHNKLVEDPKNPIKCCIISLSYEKENKGGKKTYHPKKKERLLIEYVCRNI